MTTDLKAQILGKLCATRRHSNPSKISEKINEIIALLEDPSVFVGKWEPAESAHYDTMALFYTVDGNIVQGFIYDGGPEDFGYTHTTQLLPPPKETKCKHEWIDIRNKVIISGEMCLKCRALRGGNST